MSMHDLLADAAATPSRPLQVTEVWKAGRRRRTRVRIVITTALAAAAAAVVAATVSVLPRLGTVGIEPAGPGAGTTSESARPCNAAQAQAENYGTPKVAAAFETTAQALRRWPKPSSALDNWSGSERVWLCYFTGSNPDIAKAPPPRPNATVNVEPFDRVAFVVGDNGVVQLHSLSHSDTEPGAPPGSKRIR